MQRRHLLRTVGAASALGTGSASALADQTDENGECTLPYCIHPTLGYVGLSADETPPDGLRPDHEVALELRPGGEGGGGGDSSGEGSGGNQAGGGNQGDGDEQGSSADSAHEPPTSAEELPEFVFEPTGLAVESGDVVQFTASSPDHTVTAYHPRHGRQRRVPEGVPPFSSPVLPVQTFWLYRFEEPGVYDIYCAPHEIFGMAMRIVVDGGEANFGEAAYPEQRGPEFTAATVLDDPALDPQTIVEEGAVSWDALADESKALQIEFAEPPTGNTDENGSDGGGSGGDGGVTVGEETLEDGDLRIAEHEFVVEEGVLGGVSVRGIVENTGDSSYDSVEVQVTAYDGDGNQLDQYLDITSDLGGGDSWEFEVPVVEEAGEIAEYDIAVSGTQF